MFQLNKDEKLVEKALGGSQRSWVNLVKRYEGLVFNYCLRMTFNRSDAMDLMQEVFLATYRNLPSYRGQNQFKGWMMRIAANKTTDFLRSRGRNPLHRAGEVTDDSYDNPEITHNSPSYASADHQDPATQYHIESNNKQIKSLLEKLPDDQKIVVELKFFQHFTFDEIAHQTGNSINTVKTRLYTALRKLKDFSEIKNVM
ncbi:MAG: sigma-70 family RNA polymerase sigma factor [Kangiellaceae bacterium]|nr:sigma-70 family RNA polymerase sigma factor [Kangiellaceae bacterium]